MSEKSLYQFKRLLEELEGKSGRGTELISVYIPPGYDLSKVMAQLREEQGTAENIKSKTTRKNVLGALERVIQFLRTYMETNRATPPNGMVIFAGNVAGREDNPDIQLYWIEPPEPVPIRLYRCDQRFVLEPLKQMLEPKELVGLITLDGKEATIALLKGKHLEVLDHLYSGVWGKHSRGGQSARRFERIREYAMHEYMKRVAEAATQAFGKFPELKCIIIGGPGPTKEEFLKAELLPPDLAKKVVAVLDTCYTDEYGAKELLDRAEEVLKELEIAKEKSLMKKFMMGLVSPDVPITYGEEEVRKQLEAGAVEVLLLSEKLRKVRVKVRCGACGKTFQETTNNLDFYQKQLQGRNCPFCGELRLSVQEAQDVVRELMEIAEKFGSKVEFISTETDEGKQLHESFGGIGALLRFRVQG
ncbi:MAG: peptide chain release factor 1 [Hadesarchaea archaeon]|nr:MAG: peptide chain release factor 1 [Hadesarchaea archaeon]